MKILCLNFKLQQRNDDLAELLREILSMNANEVENLPKIEINFQPFSLLFNENI